MFALFFLRLFWLKLTNYFRRTKDFLVLMAIARSVQEPQSNVRRRTGGPRITAIPIICMEGMVEVGIYLGNVDGARFEEFVDQKLCPNLLPFNGVNPRSVVIMGKVKLFATRT